MQTRPAAPVIGVVADDVTGANDIGIMFALSGYQACVYPASVERVDSVPDACILNTNSRLDTPELAYQKVFSATRRLVDMGCERFFNKTCSVFRGNIGAEFDAMLDASGHNFAVVVLGYPKNGRTTVGGVHYVHGVRLEDSEFRNDPVHPMTRSHLVDILQRQTRRQVDHLPGALLDQGPEAARAAVQAKKSTCSYLILDVRSQSDLECIAAAVKDEPVLCGSSALAEVLPVAWGIPGRESAAPALAFQPGAGILIISGSLMPQTAAQVAHMAAAGAAVIEMDPAALVEPAGAEVHITALSTHIADLLRSGQNVVLHAGQGSASIERARRAGEQAGLSPVHMSRLISSQLAEAGIRALESAGQNRLVVAGGETSDAVCARLGVTGLQIGREIEPGLPSCITLSSPHYLLALKSGSFGTPAFLQKAVDHLKERF